MIVGGNIAIRGDHDTGTETLLGAVRHAARQRTGRALAALAARGVAVILRLRYHAGNVEEPAKHRVIDKRGHVLAAHRFRRVNVDDTRRRALHDGRVAHAIGRVPVDWLAVDRNLQGRALV